MYRNAPGGSLRRSTHKNQKRGLRNGRQEGEDRRYRCNGMQRLLVGVILIVLALLDTRVDAQEDLGLPGGPPRLPPLPQLEERPRPPQPPPGKVLPPIPLPPAEQAEPLPLLRVLIREIRVVWSTVF